MIVTGVSCGTSETGGDAGPTAGSRVDLNDVSILFPLPASEAVRDQFLWLVPRDGESGPYFPAQLVDQLPPLNADLPDSLGYPNAMVTALRFDPCARAAVGAPCEAQLRLVAQAVVVKGTTVQMLEDAAVHVFYRLDAAASQDVVRGLVAIRDASPVSTAGRLRVHPGLGRTDSRAVADAVRALVVQHCREDNLFRLTVNSFAFDNWGFAKFELVNGTLERQVLQNMVMPETSQAWLRQATQDDLSDPSGTISPAPLAGFPYLLSIANYTSGAPRDANAARDAATALLRIENPRATLTEEVDCVGCHLATQTRLFARRNGVDFAASPQFDPPAGYDTTLELAPELDGNLSATIAFGWHRTRDEVLVPSISQRVINESAVIADMLSR